MSADRAFNSGPRGASRLIGYDDSSTDTLSTDDLSTDDISTDDLSTDDISTDDLSKADRSKTDVSKPVDDALRSVRAEVAVCA
ncbi:MAG: hypothetical protein R6U01_01770 [Halorubrum sp.]|uniref:hypothetical protein n=1 Tax=Halorubrum sp. TaxID=1879286 RepID=UPI0039707DE4